MLNPNYRYLALDFETTGLDLDCDEPIQIGILEFDPQGKLLQSFQSLLKPQRDTQQLKSIVGFITGLSLEQLQKAPYPAQIVEEIEHFFWENTVIVGHNIAFDTHFLQKFFPSLKWFASIDTFPLAQSLIHYTPSYALEVLVEKLSIQGNFSKYCKEFGCNLNQGANFHDALFDAKLTASLFLYLIERIYLIGENYPQLWQTFQKTDSDFFYLNDPQNWESNDKISIPPLKKISPANTSIKESDYDFDLKNYPHGQRYRYDHLKLKLLLQAFAKQQKLILAFSNQAKFAIAKNILNEMGIKNLGFLKPEQTLNRQALEDFVNKEQFNFLEFLFLIKYFSHLEQGLGVLDLNSKANYEIYTALKDQRESVNYPLILTTHGGLFAFLENREKAFEDYGIIFFDTEWRYKNYNFFRSRPYDPNYTINYIEMLVYKYQLQLEYNKIHDSDYAHLVNFQQEFLMFIGILGQETKRFFTHTDASEITLNPIIGNIAFYQSNKLIEKLRNYEMFLEKLLNPEEFSTLWKQFFEMLEIFQGLMKVEKKMYEKSGFYFLYAQETSFTNWEEFLDIFASHHTLFLSHHDQVRQLLLPETITQEAEKSQNKNLPKLELPALKIPAIKQRIQHFDLSKAPNATIFILSVIKTESKEIFESLIAAGFDKEYTLLVENITGGVGKNIFKAQQQGKTIIIGGYNFLLQLFAQKVAIFDLIVYNNKGKQQATILHDILWYGATLLGPQTSVWDL